MPFHILWSINLYEAVEKEKSPHGQHDTHQGQTLFVVKIKIFTFVTSPKYFIICLKPNTSAHTNPTALQSGINVGPTFINFEFFSRPYSLLKGPTFINFILFKALRNIRCWKCFHGLHYFCQIFQNRAFNKAVGPGKKSKINKRRAYVYSRLQSTYYVILNREG